MDDAPYHNLEEMLRRRFGDFVSSRGVKINAVLHTMRTMRTRGWNVFFFGGVPRGVFDDGKRYQPRDIDLVFDDEHYSFFESAFEHHIVKRNNYGGLKLRINDFHVDAWPLSATWAFRNGILPEPSFEKLPTTTFLNIDAVIVEAAPPKFRKRRIFDSGFFSGWRDKTLNINLAENPYPGICVARTLHISKTFGFRLSYPLVKYIYEMLNVMPIKELLLAQTNHYGFIEFDGRLLLDIYRKVERHLETTSSLPMTLFSLRPVQTKLEILSRRRVLLKDKLPHQDDGDLFDAMRNANSSEEPLLEY